MTLRWLTVSMLVYAAACGGSGHPAPFTPYPGETAGTCLSTAEALVDTRAALREGALAELSPVALQVLVDEGGLRIVLPALRTVLREDVGAQVPAIVADYLDGAGLARLTPHILELVSYVDGSGVHVDAANFAPVDTLHQALTRCDPLPPIQALAQLLEMRVTRTDGQVVPWLDETFDALLRVAEDPLFTDLLATLQISDAGDPGRVVVGRDAFQFLARLLVRNVASPDFDLAYTRTLINDVLLQQLPEGEDVRVHLNELLDLLQMAVDPAAEIFPAMQELIVCIEAVDDDDAFAGLVYDYLSTPALDLSALLHDLDRMGSDPTGEALRITLVDLDRVLRADPRLARDSVQVLARFLSPELSRQALPSLLALRGRGVVTDLLTVLQQVVNACREAL